MGSSLNGNYCWCQGAGGGGGGGDITALLNPLWADAEMATARRCHRTSSADECSESSRHGRDSQVGWPNAECWCATILLVLLVC